MKRFFAWGMLLALAAYMLASAAMAGVTTEYKYTDKIAPGSAASLLPFDTRGCDRIGVFGVLGVADSVRYYVRYSVDGVNYTLIDSTDVYADSSGTYGFDRQLAHKATAGGTSTSYFDGFIYPKIVIAILNLATVDTLDDGVARLGIICGE